MMLLVVLMALLLGGLLAVLVALSGRGFLQGRFCRRAPVRVRRLEAHHDAWPPRTRGRLGRVEQKPSDQGRTLALRVRAGRRDFAAVARR
jgi:hypothetical protein